MLRVAAVIGMVVCAAGVVGAAGAASADPGRDTVAFMTGTFDPVHEGHIGVAEAVRRQTGAREVVLIPRLTRSSKSPVEIEHRLAMLRRAVRGHEGLRVADEAMMKRLVGQGEGALVDQLRAEYPSATLVRVAGMDHGSWAWRPNGSARRDFETHGVRLILVPRDGYAVPPKLPDWVSVLSHEDRSFSSGAIRRDLGAGIREPEGLRRLPTVLQYIRRNGLYGTHATTSGWRAWASRLGRLGRGVARPRR